MMRQTLHVALFAAAGVFALSSAAMAAADPNNPAAFRSELARRLQTSYVEEVKATDVILQRRGSQVTAELAWERRLHMFGNMYILLEFEATSAR